MTDSAPWFAFAGQGWLSTDANQLTAALRDLREETPTEGPWAGLLEELESALAHDPEGLEREYVRLFLNPAGAPCPPWQSTQGPEPRLMGPPHASALAWYRTLSVEPQLGNEPADHIGLLLTFYARMLAEDAAAETRRRYWQDHLAWMPDFCAAVRAAARHPFYAALARATAMLTEAAEG